MTQRKEPMHLFAQPYNEWLSLCGQTIPSGGATIEVYEYRRAEYCADCLADGEDGYGNRYPIDYQPIDVSGGINR